MCEIHHTYYVEGAIFYKDDEARFNQQHTLKLKTYSKYNVTMEVEPAMEVSWVSQVFHKEGVDWSYQRCFQIKEIVFNVNEH